MNENGRQRLLARSRPTMLPLKQRTLRTRAQTKLNGSPVSSAVLGAGGSAIGLETGAVTGAITAIDVRLCHGPVCPPGTRGGLSYDRSRDPAGTVGGDGGTAGRRSPWQASGGALLDRGGHGCASRRRGDHRALRRAVPPGRRDASGVTRPAP